MTDSLAIGIISNRKLVRKALIYLLLSVSVGLKPCTTVEADTLEEITDSLAGPDLDVLVLDAEGIENPLKYVHRLRELSPSTKSLLLTDNTDETFAVQAVRSGAWGLVTKQVEPKVFGLAIQKVADGEMWFNHGIISLALQTFSNDQPSKASVLDRLTPREMEVLSLLSKGLQNKEIASRLNLSINTVRRYTEAIYRKLGVNSRMEAVICYNGNSERFFSSVQDQLEEKDTDQHPHRPPFIQ